MLHPDERHDGVGVEHPAAHDLEQRVANAIAEPGVDSLRSEGDRYQPGERRQDARQAGEARLVDRPFENERADDDRKPEEGEANAQHVLIAGLDRLQRLVAANRLPRECPVHQVSRSTCGARQ